MFFINENLLDTAFSALKHHGNNWFFPDPPEHQIIDANWPEIRSELSKIDLDIYPGYESCEMFAPKSRLNIRRVTQLHPYDLILYTALVLDLRDDITRHRLSPDEQTVFSYRAEGAPADSLYNRAPNYANFKERLREIGARPGVLFGITDIADFYPRIYQHRLKNVLLSVTSNSKADQIRCLEKMLYRFSDGASYGIPIGPLASRVLAEALLIDVDSTLRSLRIEFVRFADDYVIVSDKVEDAEYGIRALAETLYLNHGLTLQTAKTKIKTATEYLDSFENYDEKEQERRELIDIVGGYDDNAHTYEELSEEAKTRIDGLNLSEMLEEALEGDGDIDYQEISFILGRLSSLSEPDLIPIVLSNIEKLFPVAHSLGRFFEAFTDLDEDLQKEVTEKLLEPIERREHASEYYAVWILNLFFHHEGWNNAASIARIYQQTESQAVKRYAALAISKSGTRAEALMAMRSFRNSTPLVRSALLRASEKLGADERRFKMKSLELENLMERLLAGLQLPPAARPVPTPAPVPDTNPANPAIVTDAAIAVQPETPITDMPLIRS
jgi:hypothetical protein